MLVQTFVSIYTFAHPTRPNATVEIQITETVYTFLVYYINQDPPNRGLRFASRREQALR